MVVRMRSTSSHTGHRRSHHAMEAVRLSKCKDCGAPHVRHQACPTCGKYRGKVVIDVHAALAKKKTKAEAAEPKA